jgi:hypothetical protein
MSIGDLFVGSIVLGGALAMTALTLGPAYFLFVVVPEQAKAARKDFFIRKRRELRKERRKQLVQQAKISVAS